MIELPTWANEHFTERRDITQREDKLKQWLLRQNVEDVLELVRSDQLAHERLPDTLKQAASEDHRRRLDQRTADEALSRLPEGLGIAVILSFDDPEKILAELGDPPPQTEVQVVQRVEMADVEYYDSDGELQSMEVERTTNLPEEVEVEAPWVWGVDDGYIFVQGVSSDELTRAVTAARGA